MRHPSMFAPTPFLLPGYTQQTDWLLVGIAMYVCSIASIACICSFVACMYIVEARDTASPTDAIPTPARLYFPPPSSRHDGLLPDASRPRMSSMPVRPAGRAGQTAAGICCRGELHPQPPPISDRQERHADVELCCKPKPSPSSSQATRGWGLTLDAVCSASILPSLLRRAGGPLGAPETKTKSTARLKYQKPPQTLLPR